MDEKPPGTFEICPVCFWEDDEVQFRDPDYEGGANSVSLRTAKSNFVQIGACSADYVNKVRPPTKEEMPTM